MPDAVVDYDLSYGKWNIIQQQNMLRERTRILYGTASSATISLNAKSGESVNELKSDSDNLWNDLSEFYSCEQYDVPSHDGISVPLTTIYSPKYKKENQNPGLLHGHGAYGELLDKRWRSELKSLLDRGWVVAFADVRSVFKVTSNAFFLFFWLILAASSFVFKVLLWNINYFHEIDLFIFTMHFDE